LNALPVDDLYRIQVRQLRDYAMFLIDVNGMLCSWNEGVEQLLGYSEDEWLGKHASLIFTPAERAVEVCQSEMQNTRDHGSSTDIRWHRRKDGSEFFAHGFMNSVRNDSGALMGYSKVLSDETARKQLQDSLTESNAALEQFAYVASHDMQEPLRTMSAYAQLLIKRYAGKLDPDADAFLSFIVGGSARMSALIRDLLTFAQITTETERPSSIALDEDLETALTNLTETVVETGAIITHDPLPTIPADRGQMIRLFQNLVGNAIKYRKPAEPPVIHITARQQGPEWVISVQDNGIGFNPKYASTIFQPFKRLHTNDTYPGTGVGLAICRRIVDAHGGRLWAESEPGKGSTFHFTLPLEGKPPGHYTAPVTGSLGP